MHRLSKHVYLIEKNGGKYPFCNCVYIKDRKTCLIDTGAGDEVIKLKPDFVLNSHWHEDHITNNHLFRAKIGVHELDAEAVESYEEFKKRYGLSDKLVKIFINFEFTKVDFTFRVGDVLNFGDTEVEVIHTPGHSAGHCCFLIDGEMIYLGDIDLTSFGPWYGCLDCDVNDFIESIHTVLKIVDRRGIEMAVSGHKGVVTGEDIKSKLEEYLKRLLDRESKIRDMLSKGIDPENMIGKGLIYRKLPDPVEVFKHFERVMVRKHIERFDTLQQ
ncbi:Zn-dependent hydrolase, including glyoxylase [Archaeoglobus sulfaticallidus PM70-1]|uniref:Zn-dependent hydrolase, including glyoxylase n=1 Tax=Archaeoglobus sulfaticallidus PM70-1 TaxID=387631 RepID=N0BHX3_9EURY|nr:MBL fold metallo-hydrolase [Archaeoglobus sulfaticallidus]AGK61907.1 Zn-dependent hydrolase, including glyoxylase [Archaeoglobus sulfaticallidus PM70-1]